MYIVYLDLFPNLHCKFALLFRISVTNQQQIMEEVLIRFPHLGDKILKKLDSKSLFNCKEVNRTFEDFMKVEKRSYLHAIQWYTNCSESLMREIVEKYGAAIIILSILREIYGKFCRNTKQHHKYLQKYGNTPLHVAAKMGQSGAYHLIMENVANKNPFQTISDATNWKCMRRGKLDKWFLPQSATPLHLAAKNGNLSVCKLIIENVLDKNPTACLYPELREQKITNTQDQWTPLHLAANYGHFSVCELIINKISGKNPKDQQEWTPLHSAAQNGHLRVCELIINKVSEKNPKDQQGWTPLHSAAQNGHLEVCELILRNIRKGNPDSYNPYDELGNSPFKLATQFFHQQIVTLLLKFIFDAEERKGTFDDFKIQLVQDLEKQDIEIQENNKKKGITKDSTYQIMKIRQENKKREEKLKNEEKEGQSNIPSWVNTGFLDFHFGADDRDDREING